MKTTKKTRRNCTCGEFGKPGQKTWLNEHQNSEKRVQMCHLHMQGARQDKHDLAMNSRPRRTVIDKVAARLTETFAST